MDRWGLHQQVLALCCTCVKWPTQNLKSEVNKTRSHTHFRNGSHQFLLANEHSSNSVVVPWNDDSILVVLQLEGEGVLFGVLSGRNASAGLRLLNVLHELKIHIKCVGVPNWTKRLAKIKRKVISNELPSWSISNTNSWENNPWSVARLTKIQR